MSETNYGLVEPFGIDGGELDGLGPELCFVLGVEWQLFREQMLATPESFEVQIMVENAGRLQALCLRHGRSCRRQPVEGYPQYCVLWVHPG